MARWRCNAPEPGSFLQGRGIIKPKQEFSTPDDENDPFFERAREMWIPLDGAAESLVEKAKADAEKMRQEAADRAAATARREDEARRGIVGRPFQTRPEQDALGRGRGRQSEPQPTEEEQARDKGWRDELARQRDASLTPEQRAQAQTYERDRTARASGAPPTPAGTTGDNSVQPRAPAGHEPVPGTAANTGPSPAAGTPQEQVERERAAQAAAQHAAAQRKK